MSRSHSPLGLALAAVAALATTTVAVASQGQPVAVEVRDLTTDPRQLTLPVLDLQLETASLDLSLRRVERRVEVRVTLAADVLFEFDRARLTPRARSRIAEAAAEIRRLDPRSVMIEGHTDSVGAPAYNRGLSRRRADAVRQALTRALGGERPRLLATGKGESEPVAANKKADGSDDPKGRARNRRVEIRIPKS